jgi:hypothetical protein
MIAATENHLMHHSSSLCDLEKNLNLNFQKAQWKGVNISGSPCEFFLSLLFCMCLFVSCNYSKSDADVKR